MKEKHIPTSKDILQGNDLAILNTNDAMLSLSLVALWENALWKLKWRNIITPEK